MSRTYDEVMEDLQDRAEYELVVSTARVDSDEHDGDTSIAIVTVDGVTRGVVGRDGVLPALLVAAERVTLGEDAGAVRLLRAAIEEVGFDRAVDLLENQR